MLSESAQREISAAVSEEVSYLRGMVHERNREIALLHARVVALETLLGERTTIVDQPFPGKVARMATVSVEYSYDYMSEKSETRDLVADEVSMLLAQKLFIQLTRYNSNPIVARRQKLHA